MRAILACVVLVAASTAVAEDGWVVLSVPEFKELRAKARPTPEPPAPPPQPVVLTRVDYDLEVGADTALGEARLSAEVFAEGWVRLPLPPGLRISRAFLENRPVPILRTAEGKSADPTVLLSRLGRTTLRLEIAVALGASGGEESLSLPTGPVTRASLRLRRSSVDVRARGGLVLEQQEAGGVARIVAHGTGGAPLQLIWERRREAQAPLPLRFRGAITHVVSLAEDSAQLSAEVSAEVVQGSLPGLKVKLPTGFVVNEVRGATIADWSVASGLLAVSFLEPVEGKVAITLTGEVPTAREGIIAIPLLRLPDAEREGGGVAVEVLGSGQIDKQDPRGLDPADPSELGASVAGRDAVGLVTYRFRPGGPTLERGLSVGVARYTAAEILETNVEEARFAALTTAEGRTLVQARYAVRNRARSFLTVTLPPSAVLWSAAVGGRAVRPGLAQAGALLLPLDKAGGAENPPAFVVEVVYLDRGNTWSPEGQASLTLPSVDLPVGRAGFVLHHPGDYRLTPKPGAFRLESFREAESPAFFAAASGEGPVADMPVAPAPAAKVAKKAEAPAEELKALADRFQRENRAGARVAGVLPVQVPFPAFGPSLFLAAELQPEGQPPTVTLDYRKEKR